MNPETGGGGWLENAPTICPSCSLPKGKPLLFTQIVFSEGFIWGSFPLWSALCWPQRLHVSVSLPKPRMLQAAPSMVQQEGSSSNLELGSAEDIGSDISSHHRHNIARLVQNYRTTKKACPQIQLLSSINHFEIPTKGANGRQTRKAPFQEHFKAPSMDVNYFLCLNWLLIFHSLFLPHLISLTPQTPPNFFLGRMLFVCVSMDSWISKYSTSCSCYIHSLKK